jgi:AraC family transcriptional regulator
LAKIAVESGEEPKRDGPVGSTERLRSRILAQGPGWGVADTICTAGPKDRAFEEQHSEVNIAIVVSGSFQYRGAPGQELMTPGSLFLGNAGQYFECGHEHGVGDRCISFRFSCDYFEALAADLSGCNATRAFKVLRLPPLRELSPLVARACAGLRAGLDIAWEELGVLIVAKTLGLARGKLVGSNDFLPSELARATRVVRMIERETDCKLPLRALAAQAGLSTYHFLRSFQKLTGLTPHQYVRRTRLREAAGRLASGSDKVLDVALQCGFEDVSNFNRAFRAEFGTNPQAYRGREQRDFSLRSPTRAREQA